MSDISIYIVRRVKDLAMAHVPSVKKRCIDCGEEVWVANRLKHFASVMDIICTRCIDRRLEAGKTG